MVSWTPWKNRIDTGVNSDVSLSHTHTHIRGKNTRATLHITRTHTHRNKQQHMQIVLDNDCCCFRLIDCLRAVVTNARGLVVSFKSTVNVSPTKMSPTSIGIFTSSLFTVTQNNVNHVNYRKT